jgi:archaellum biogenesis ATPase FlaH
MDSKPPPKSSVGTHAASDDELQELLRPARAFESRVEEIVKSLPLGTTHLLLLSIKEYASSSHALLSFFGEKKMPGVYVTVNRPCADIIHGMKNPPENVKYVDAITALTGRDTVDTINVTYLDSPLALVELNLAIAENLKKVVSNQKFLILDSVSTLLVYNSSQAVEKFCHTIITKTRSENLVGLFLMVESEEHRAVVETLAQFVDSVVTVE